MSRPRELPTRQEQILDLMRQGYRVHALVFADGTMCHAEIQGWHYPVWAASLKALLSG